MGGRSACEYSEMYSIQVADGKESKKVRQKLRSGRESRKTVIWKTREENFKREMVIHNANYFAKSN